jgi:RHS repeat-associated protein
LTSLFNVESDGSLISGFDYGHDDVGNRTSVLEASGDRVTWTYDATYQLTSEQRSGVHAYHHTFVYDPVGNRLVKNEDGALTTYTYDAANQLETSREASGMTTYTFDANGNQHMVQGPGGTRTTYVWDCENQMTLIQEPGGECATIASNADKRRVRTETDMSVTNHIWDAENDTYLGESDEAGTDLAVYTNEPGRYGPLVSRHRESQTNYYHYDGLHSTRQLTDETEAVLHAATYTAFGDIVAQSGSTDNPFGFTGALGCYTNPRTREVYVRARSYQEETGRWHSRDPLGYADGANLYCYVYNNPVNLSDPSGNYTIPDARQHLCQGICQYHQGTYDTPFGVITLDYQQCVDTCVHWAATTDAGRQSVFDHWVERERERENWWEKLQIPKCPARICVTRVEDANGNLVATISKTDEPGFDPPRRVGYHEGRYHPGAVFSMRSKPVSGHSNQCIYDAAGKLMREPPSHGTIDSVAPGITDAIVGIGHVAHDVHPVEVAARLDGCWVSGMVWGRIKANCVGPNMQQYYEVRPHWAQDEPKNGNPCCNTITLPRDID